MAGEVDKFGSHPESLESPYSAAFIAAYHDTNDFAIATRGVYFNATGNVAIVPVKGPAVVIPVLAGTYLPLRLKRINATSTTAAVGSIVGMY